MKHKPTREDNFIWLLAALVLLLFLSALFSQLDLKGARLLVNAGMGFTVITAVWSMHSASFKWFSPGTLIALVIVILTIVDSSIESTVLAPVQLVATFLFLSVTIYFAWREVMFTGDITRNTIFGAICIYMLIGLWFGFAYMIVEYFDPDSISGLDSELWQENLHTIAYYSMVTLTTLGYGDITPASPLTRFLAYMEAAIGVFYTTVLVASLIGLRLAGYTSTKQE